MEGSNPSSPKESPKSKPPLIGLLQKRDSSKYVKKLLQITNSLRFLLGLVGKPPPSPELEKTEISPPLQASASAPSKLPSELVIRKENEFQYNKKVSNPTRTNRSRTVGNTLQLGGSLKFTTTASAVSVPGPSRSRSHTSATTIPKLSIL
jgi:hypothetical protein